VRKSLSGSDDELSLTSRIAARALMTGKITKIADRHFNLDFSITDTETHEVLAGYNQNHSDIELTGGIAVNRMTGYFLGELGVRLNEAGKLALLGNSNEDATALAKGRAAAEAGRDPEAMNYPLRKFRVGTVVTGGYTLGTEETAIVDLGLFFGSNFWNLDLGLKFYPGSQTGHLTADYKPSGSGSSKDPSIGVMGIETGLDFALVGRRWLLNTGGGVTFFLAWASSDADSGSGTKNMGNDFFVIPYLKLCLD
jgi:hypothetical protein